MGACGLKCQTHPMAKLRQIAEAVAQYAPLMEWEHFSQRDAVRVPPSRQSDQRLNLNGILFFAIDMSVELRTYSESNWWSGIAY